MQIRLPSKNPRSRKPGFTLVELLVVIGIIALLVGVLLPMVMRARKSAAKIRMKNTLQTLSTGLEAYNQAWGAYPVFDNGYNSNAFTQLDRDNQRLVIDSGPRALYSGLVGKWAIRVGSEPYGPFVNVDNLRVDRVNFWILDDYDKPILYVPAAFPKPNFAGKVGPTGTQLPAFCADGATLGPITGAHTLVSPFYDHRAANQTYSTAGLANVKNPLISLFDMRVLLGDDGTPKPGNPPKPDGIITGTEAAVTSQPYLLWMAGFDGVFGFAAGLPATAPLTDDVANFDFPSRYVRN